MELSRMPVSSRKILQARIKKGNGRLGKLAKEIVNSCDKDIQHSVNKKSVKSANYHLNKFLTDPA